MRRWGGITLKPKRRALEARFPIATDSGFLPAALRTALTGTHMPPERAAARSSANNDMPRCLYPSHLRCPHVP